MRARGLATHRGRRVRRIGLGLVAASAAVSIALALLGGATAVSAAQTQPNCALRTDVVFWTGSDHLRLAQALAANRSPCADYWISVPPLAANKKALRVLQDDAIRALGIHPVAEFTTGEETGWANWVNEPGTNRTWFDAGVEFRREMADAGYDVTKGETWLINEFDRSTARDAPRTPPDHDWPAARRADMRDLMRGLYQGAPGMPPAPGIAEIGIHFRHQNIPNVDEYRHDMQGWLADTSFWADADRYLRWIAVENYPDSRLWAPPGSTLQDRSRHLQAYIFHLLELVRSDPGVPQLTRSFFERKFLPFANSGWRARGGDQFDFVTGHGNTILDDVQMRQFVSEQVYAMRDYAGAHPHRAPAGRLGFSWQPCNRLAATEPDCRPVDAAFDQSLTLITARIAEAIRYAYGEGHSTAAGACSPPAGSVDWCQGSLPGAAFTSAWDGFGRVAGSGARRSIDAVAFSPDGRILAAGSNTTPDAPGIVRLWNAATRAPIGRLVDPSGAVDALAFTPDGRLLVSGGTDGTIRLWDLPARRQSGSPLRGHRGAVRSVAVSPDGRTVASAGDDGTVRLWNMRTRNQLGSSIEIDYGGQVAFSTDGRTLLSAGFDAQLWSLATRRRLGPAMCHSSFGLAAVALAGNARTLACALNGDSVADPSSSLVLWSTRTPRRLGAPLKGHTDGTLSVAFSPNGRLLASGGGIQDGTVRLWDVRSLAQIGAPLRGHGNAVASVAFSPDGRMLASGGWDGTVRLWDVGTHRQLGGPLGG
jgi:WD40 repeat protein